MMIQPILRIVPVEHAFMTFYEGFPRILNILNLETHDFTLECLKYFTNIREKC